MFFCFLIIFGQLKDDFSFEKESSKRMSAFLKKKPPLPAKSRKLSTREYDEEKTNEEGEEVMRNGENPEMTIESIRLNESDLKELEDEFTFEEEDEDVQKDNSLLPKTGVEFTLEISNQEEIENKQSNKSKVDSYNIVSSFRSFFKK